MPKVMIELQVVDKATAETRRALGEVEKSLTGVQKAGAGAAQGVQQYNKSSEQSTVSMRDTKQAIGALSMAFGQFAPQATYGALEVSRFIEQLKGTTLATKSMQIGMVAAGGAVAALVAQFMATEQIAAKFAVINTAVKALDFGAVQGGLREVRLELEAADRQMKSWVGTFVMGAQNIGRTLLGLPNAIAEAQQRMEALRSGLQQIMPILMGQEAAVHGVEMAGLGAQGRQQGLQGLMGRGAARPTDVATTALRLRETIMGGAQEAESVLGYQRRKEIAEAGARGTLDIEGEAIQARFLQRREELYGKRDIQLAAVEEQRRQQMESIRGQTEQRRASGAGLAIERQQAGVDLLKAEMEGGKSLLAKNEAFARGIGVPAWMFATVNPQARILIEEEKKARLMAIDETMKKNVYSIDQLKLAEEDRARMVAEAEATAQTQRSTAIQEAVTKERDLYDTAQKLRTELFNAGLAVKDGIGANLERAATSARDIVDSTSVIGMPSEAFQGNKPGASAAWQKFWATPETGPGSKAWWSGGAWGNNAWDPMPTGYVSKPRDESPVSFPGMQSGGFVPGPIGAPRPILAHGGEVVLNPEQQASINPSFAPNITINIGGGEDVDVVARKVAKSVGKQLAVFEARGVLGYRKQSPGWTP